VVKALKHFFRGLVAAGDAAERLEHARLDLHICAGGFAVLERRVAELEAVVRDLLLGDVTPGLTSGAEAAARVPAPTCAACHERVCICEHVRRRA
jgi:hypothetical protein